MTFDTRKYNSEIIEIILYLINPYHRQIITGDNRY